MHRRTLIRVVAPAAIGAAILGATLAQQLAPMAINPQPLPPAGRALNPQPLPPGARALNTQPLPPRMQALNPQPLPPRTHI